MMILTDTSTTIGIIVFSIIGFVIVAIVIGSIISKNSEKRRKEQEDKTNQDLEQIVKTNPDALFDAKMEFFSNKKVIYRALDNELKDWDVCKKFALMKKLGLFRYNEKWGNIETECITYDSFYYLDFYSVLYNSYERCFELKEGSKLRQLKDYKEAICCYLIYQILCDYRYSGDSHDIRSHKGLQHLDSLFITYIDRFVKSGDDPVFEETLKKVYEVFPLKRMFEKDSRYGYRLFRDLIKEIYS